MSDFAVFFESVSSATASTDPKYFGKSAFSDLKNVSKAALDIMSGKKEEEPPQAEVKETEQEKTDG